jgi:N-acetyl-gamma-glutamyl-phosphate reductase
MTSAELDAKRAPKTAPGNAFSTAFGANADGQTMTRARIFIDGEAGTTGLRIRTELSERPDIELISISAAERKDPEARRRLLNAADVAILCLPDDAAREAVSLIDNTSTRVIDASTAHRTAEGWTYGFPEMTAGQPQAIAAAKRVANPGCWPQGFIAIVRPLIEAGLLPADAPYHYNGVSGYTGGGRKMVEDYESAADASPFFPYSFAFKHKHLPEMLTYGRAAMPPLFQPSVGNYAQGMLTAVPLQLWSLPGKLDAETIHAALADRYAGSTFIEVAPLEHVERIAGLDPRALNGTNAMRLQVFGNSDRRQALVMAIYDNLGKGASGAAIQNLNLMLGVDEATGLRSAP